jgi:hypothetical protein
MNLDLENPIFTININCEGMGRQRAEEKIYELSKHYYKYDNATFWVLPQTEGKSTIELIWKGSKFMADDESTKASINKLHKRLDSILEILTNNTSDSDTIKQQLRELSINEILDGTI